MIQYIVTWIVVAVNWNVDTTNVRGMAYPFKLTSARFDTVHFYERQPAIDFYNAKVNATHHIETPHNPDLYLPFQNIKLDSIQ